MRWSAAQALSWTICKKPLPIKQWTNTDIGHEFENAKKILSTAIANGHVQAWGRPKPQAPYEKVPSEQFAIPGIPVGVDAHGEMVSLKAHLNKLYTGPRWSDIHFEPEEIKREWPKPASPSVDEWMSREAKRLDPSGRIKKRDDMVARCKEEIGCTKREAEAAHKRLPDELRRPRGKPPKNAG